MKRPFEFRTFPTLVHLLAVCATFVAPCFGVNLTWDADNATGGAQDGPGTWASGGPNWFDTTNTLDNQNFTNGDAVTFGAGSGAAGNVTINGTVTTGSVTFSAPGSGSYSVINGASTPNLNLSSGAIINVAAGLAPTISATITGTTGYTKSGTGTLTVSGANSYTGTTTLSQGSLFLNSNSASDAAGYTLGDSNTGSENLVLRLNSGFSSNNTSLPVVGNATRLINVTVSNQGSGTATIDVSASGTNPNLALVLNRATILKGPKTQLFAGISGTGTTAGTDALILDVAGGNFVWTTNQATSGAGTANSFTGNVRIMNSGAGTPLLQMQNLAYAGNIAGNQNLMIPDTASVTVDSNVTWAITHGVETIDALNGGGAIRPTSGTGYLAGTPILTVGANNGSGSHTGVLQNNGVAFSIAKTGTGTQALGGNSTYTGGTIVRQGKLSAEGANNPLGTGAITLGDANTGANTITLSFDKLTSSPTLATVTVANFGTGTTIRGTQNPSGTNSTPNFPLVLNKAVTLQVGESNSGFASDLTFESVSGAGAGAGNDSILINANNGSNRTLRTSITNAGTASNFTGNVRVTQGRWQMQNRSYNGNTAGNQNLVVPDTSSVTLDSGTTWSITHGVETIDALNGSGTVNLGGGSYLPGAAQLTVGAGNTIGNFTGVLQSMTLEKTGTSTPTPGGTVDNNSLAVIVTNGTLVLAKTSSGTVHAVGSGTTVNGGTLQLGGNGGDQIFNNSNVAVNGGIFDLNGNNETINALTLAGGTVSGLGTLTGGATINAQSGTASSNLAGAVGLSKTTIGTVTLGGANNYSGTTSITAGTLLVNGTHTGGTGYSVGSSGTLGGTGSTASTVTVDGILSPGASIESFASGALTMTSGSTFVFEAVDSSTTGADLMVANGLLSLTAVNLNLTGANLASNTWTAGNKLTLISYTDAGTGITSGFNTYADDTIYTFGSNNWLFNYNDAAKGNNFNSEATGNHFVTLTLVPEPSSFAMLMFGSVMFWLVGRKRTA